MELPFTDEAFLDVFGRYNVSLLSGVVALWISTAALVIVWLRRRHLSGRVVFALLGLHWAWSGIAYHWLFFRSINSAAAIFAMLFIVQSLFFAWLAASSRGAVVAAWSIRGVAGAALVLYGLAYPFVGLAFGLVYPRLPLFAVPCPTALITAGFLVTSSEMVRVINIVPVLWAIIGSSAAFALGIRADLVLVVAGSLLGLDTLIPSMLGPRSSA